MYWNMKWIWINVEINKSFWEILIEVKVNIVEGIK